MSDCLRSPHPCRELVQLRADLARVTAERDGWEEIARTLARVTAERDRLRTALEGFVEHDCSYGDGCPPFGSRHGQCIGCKARKALEAAP